MSLACKFGFHTWRGCKCSKCGKYRNEEHDWSEDCEKCSLCGKTRTDAHAWNGCKCDKCGKYRNEEHDWSEDCEKCSLCGKTRTDAHIWNGCKCDKCGKQTTQKDVRRLMREYNLNRNVEAFAKLKHPELKPIIRDILANEIRKTTDLGIGLYNLFDLIGLLDPPDAALLIVETLDTLSVCRDEFFLGFMRESVAGSICNKMFYLEHPAKILLLIPEHLQEFVATEAILDSAGYQTSHILAAIPDSLLCKIMSTLYRRCLQEPTPGLIKCIASTGDAASDNLLSLYRHFKKGGLDEAHQRAVAEALLSLRNDLSWLKETCGKDEYAGMLCWLTLDTEAQFMALVARRNSKTTLLEAVSREYVKATQALLLEDVDIESRGPNERTALHLAALRGNLELVKLLIEHGADIHAVTSDGETPLHMAISPAWAPRLNREVVQCLVDAGCRVNQHDTTEGWTPLYTSVAAACIGVGDKLPEVVVIAEVLLSNGASVDGLTTFGDTPLHRAVTESCGPMVQCLLEHGADAMIKSRTFGKTALEMADETFKGPEYGQLWKDSGRG